MIRQPAKTAKSAKAAVAVALLGVLVAAGAAPAHGDAPVPAPTITSGPAPVTSAASATFAFADSKAGVSFQCALDTGSFAACTSPKTYAVSPGSHSFRVRALSGSKTSAATVYSWAVDTAAPPAPSITAKPANPTDALTHTFRFADAEAGVDFRCALDGAAFAACTSPRAYANLAPGAHTFAVKARDAAGNLSPATSFGWTVLPAVPSITATPPNPSNQSGASFAFTDATPGVGFQCALDGAPFAPCASPKSYASLGQGAHTFRVRAVSGALASGPASYSWSVDTIAPPAPWILSRPADPSRTTSAMFLFIDSEMNVSYLCKLDGGPWEPCLLLKSYFNLGQGPHTFSVKARDGAGNVSAPATATWSIDTIAPPKPVLTDTPPDPAPSAYSAFAWTDAESGVTFRCRIDDSAWIPCTSPYTVTVEPGTGEHRFRVRASDAAGNTSDATSFTWEIAESAGFTVSGAPDGVLAPGVWRTLDLQISNPNDFAISIDALNVAVASSPAGCDAAANLEIEQPSVSASQTVTVPPNGTATVPPALRPRLRLKNLPVNQDTCKNKSFGLTYGGSATQ